MHAQLVLFQKPVSKLFTGAVYPSTTTPNSAESLDSKFMKPTLQHSALLERGKRCDARLFLPSVQSRFLSQLTLTHCMRLGDCSSSSAALRIVSSLARFQYHHGHNPGFGSQRAVCTNSVYTLHYATLCNVIRMRQISADLP